MTICPVTGRTHRSARQLAAELARIDSKIATIRGQLDTYADTYRGAPVPDAVGEQWNALHDTLTALEIERFEVEANPRPLRAGESGAYRLAAANID